MYTEARIHTKLVSLAAVMQSSVALLRVALGLPQSRALICVRPNSRPSTRFAPSGNPEIMAWNRYLLSSHTRTQEQRNTHQKFNQLKCKYAHTHTHRLNSTKICIEIVMSYAVKRALHTTTLSRLTASQGGHINNNSPTRTHTYTQIRMYASVCIHSTH